MCVKILAQQQLALQHLPPEMAAAASLSHTWVCSVCMYTHTHACTHPRMCIHTCAHTCFKQPNGSTLYILFHALYFPGISTHLEYSSCLHTVYEIGRLC